MPEFKIDTVLLSALISDISKNSADITTLSDISDEDVNTLKTAVKYVSQQKQIEEVLSLYKKLLAKDVTDIREMQGAATALDLKISSNFNFNMNLK